MRDAFTGLTELMAVADARSFTAAAAKLRVTPSAVSQTIRALEQRVGVRLLQRTTRSVGLTEAGARFIARLKPALAGVDEAFAALGELRDRPAGLLRLNVPRLGYDRILEPRLAAFMARYPEIDLEISLDDALANIVEQGFDAGIRIGESVDREMVAVRISQDLRVAVVGSPAYFAKHGKPKHPRDLAAHDCIAYRLITSGAVYRWEFTEQGKDFEIAPRGRIITNDGEVMRRLALAGLGLVHTVDASVLDDIKAKRLIRVLEPWCTPFAGFFLYYPSRTHIAPKLAALVEFLKVRATPAGARTSSQASPKTTSGRDTRAR
jgi:DNA-binding transcriptional LysR family regulator